jgi:arsenate reductase
MTVTIYHNPACGTSRTTLELLRASGIQPKVIEYLKHPPTRSQLQRLLRAARVRVRDAIRNREPIYAELGLDNPELSDEALLDAMVAHPILIQRPIVQTSSGVRLCRPAERVLDILPAAHE